MMPPVGTIGIGLSLGDAKVALGAGLLFFTNFAAISFGGILIFAGLGFRPIRPERTWHRIPRSLLISAGLVLLTAVPLEVLTMRIVEQAQELRQVRAVVAVEISVVPDTELVDVSIENGSSTLNLRITVRTSGEFNHKQVIEL